MSIVEARKNLAELVNRVSYGRERITLTRHARPAAVVVTPEDAELLELIETAIDIETARARLRSAKERPIPWAEARKRLGL
jgi:prevent-host-death family protein